MSSFKYIIPALAIAGSAAAATCSAATTTIQNAGDASGLATCQTFSGSIAIATGTNDNINLDGIQEITGSLIAQDNQQLTTLSSSSLSKIGDSFSLSKLTVLSTLNFPMLSNVKNIDWDALPALQALSFTTSVQMASSLKIQNTHLQTLDGINLAQVDEVLIANNVYLTKINMQLGNVSNTLTLTANGQNVTATFPNLIWAQNLTVSNVSDFSVPSLAAVNGSFGLYNNYYMALNASNLTSVGESLSVFSCPYVTNISFPVLTTVGGGLTIANNTALKSIDGFPSLQTVGGAVDYYGNFSNASLPALKSVVGAFNVQSTADLTSTCNTFNAVPQGNGGVIQGNYTCQGKVDNPNSGSAGNGGNGSPTSSGSPAASSSKGAAANLQISTAMTGLLGVVAAVFGML